MKFVPISLLACALVVGAAAGPAAAFTQESVGQGSSRAQDFSDPDASWGRLSSGEGSGSAEEQRSASSPFSLNVTGPDQRYSPSIDRSGTDNAHLFWNNNSRWR